MNDSSHLLQLSASLNARGFSKLAQKLKLGAAQPGGLDGAKIELLRAYNTLYSLTDDLGALYSSTGYQNLLKSDPAEAGRLDRIKREWSSSLSFLHKALEHIERLRLQSR